VHINDRLLTTMENNGRKESITVYSFEKGC